MADQNLNTPEEIWKAIPGFPGYEISDRGQIRSYWKRIGIKGKRGTTHILGNRPNILHPHIQKSGYVLAGLLKTHKRYIHDLVLCAFVGPRPNGMEACHNDGNKANNCLANLRWDTTANNALDSIRHGTTTTGEKNSMAKLTETQVNEIRKLASRGCSRKYLAEMFSVSYNSIGDIITYRTWKHI